MSEFATVHILDDCVQFHNDDDDDDKFLPSQCLYSLYRVCSNQCDNYTSYFS